MFEEYYGFTGTPFTRNLPVDLLFTTPQQEEVLARLTYAAERRWFSDQAISEIFRYSKGSARLINKACTHCLMYGSQQNKKILDDALTRHVIEQELI